jgi:predicted ATPase
MMHKLSIAGFKRFTRCELRIAPLTVLTGLNGSGKTSVIHSLLLMREATTKSSQGVVSLNGPFGLHLGTAEDVNNWAGDQNVEFRIEDDSGIHAWKLGYANDTAMFLDIKHFPDNPPDAFKGTSGAFAYVSAERFGPRASLEASSLPGDHLEVGVHGEHSAQILESLGNKHTPEDRRHPGSTTLNLLKYEVEHWLSEIARPIVIDSIRYAGVDAYALRFKTQGGEWVRATNMGFGVSYALPVILAGLTMKKNGLLIVENPEAHLHPAGQSKIGTFLAWLAAKGINVVIETHSDHVLNGIRRAIGEFEFLAAVDAVVHFFDSNESAQIQELHFTDVGGIAHWPTGFFDQYQIDTAALGRVRRKRAGNGVRS